jgi:hypothetical protein
MESLLRTAGMILQDDITGDESREDDDQLPGDDSDYDDDEVAKDDDFYQSPVSDKTTPSSSNLAWSLSRPEDSPARPLYFKNGSRSEELYIGR